MRRLKRFTLIALVFLICMDGAVMAQGKVSGRVLTDTKPITNASVLLVLAKDSSLVKRTTSNSSGAFLLDNLKPGNCRFTFHFSTREDYVDL